jgi:hypothetical protein|tara:strand:+ start:139 stop:459 length:321 start_codon:yes stop_codon:yes gene_type:complete
MAKRQNKLEIVEEFINIAYEQIKARYSEDAGIKNVLMFLIERGLVDPISLRDFMVLNDFHKILKDNEGHITYTFMDLSIKYDISDRTAQNIVYKKRKKFRAKSNIR